MPCKMIQTGDAVMLVCSRGRPRMPDCTFDGCGGLGAIQCDYVIDEHGCICDRYVCDDHSQSVGWNRDYCYEHAQCVVLQCSKCPQHVCEGDLKSENFMCPAHWKEFHIWAANPRGTSKSLKHWLGLKAEEA